MSILLTAVEVIGGTAGMAVICHRIEQMILAKNGPTTRKPADPPAIPPPWTVEDARHSAQMFLDNPLAFWLDPNLWGDDPNWRDRLFPTHSKPGHIDPVKEAQAEDVLRSHGIMVPKLHIRAVIRDERGDEIKARNREIKRRNELLAKRNNEDYDNDMPPPPRGY